MKRADRLQLHISSEIGKQLAASGGGGAQCVFTGMYMYKTHLIAFIHPVQKGSMLSE